MKTYTGGCQCKQIQYTVEMEEIKEAVECNCSICQSKGALLVFAPVEKFALVKGEENLTEYLFNTETIKHTFCKTCGVEAFAFGLKHPTVAINIRSIDDIDLSTITRNHFDGKKI